MPRDCGGMWVQALRVFPRSFTHGGICPPHMGQVQGDKALMEGHRPHGGDLTLIDYIIN